MMVIIYSTKHGATRKVARVIKAYVGDAMLMNVRELDWEILDEASSVVVGMPVYNDQLEETMVTFIREHQEFLIYKHYSIYVTSLYQEEFMTQLTKAFPYDVLKDVKVMAGLGGAVYFPELSMREKMAVRLMNTRKHIMPRDRDETIFENFKDEEIRIFAEKIKRIDQQTD